MFAMYSTLHFFVSVVCAISWMMNFWNHKLTLQVLEYPEMTTWWNQMTCHEMNCKAETKMWISHYFKLRLTFHLNALVSSNSCQILKSQVLEYRLCVWEFTVNERLIFQVTFQLCTKTAPQWYSQEKEGLSLICSKQFKIV